MFSIRFDSVIAKVSHHATRGYFLSYELSADSEAND